VAATLSSALTFSSPARAVRQTPSHHLIIDTPRDIYHLAIASDERATVRVCCGAVDGYGRTWQTA